MKLNCQRILSLLSITLLLSVWTGVKAQTLRIMPLGNSITEGTTGYTTSEGDRKSYRQTLYSLLVNAGYNFDFVGHKSTGYNHIPDANHAGIPGSRDQYVVRLLQDGYDLRWGVHTTGGQPYLDVYPADLILLHIGTNDITHGEGASPASVSAILDEIDAWEARTGNPVTVIVARIINRKDYNLTTTQYNNNVAAMVAARNDPSISMVDIENGAGIDYPTEMHPEDGIHPNESAYSKMGQKWFEAIQALNVPPAFTSTPVTGAREDILYTYNITVEDDNPMDEPAIFAVTKPGWCTFTDNGDKTAVLTGTPGDMDVGTHTVSLVVSDGKAMVNQDFTIQVTNEPDPPQITAQRAINALEDTPFELTKAYFTIVDSDSPDEDIDLIVGPGSNYTVAGNTLTPAKEYSGTLQVPVAARDLDGTGNTFIASVSVEPVNDPPVLIGQKNGLSVKQGASLQLLPMDFNYTDIDNNINDISVVITDDPDDVFLINGNYITPKIDTTGPVKISIVVNDGEDNSNEAIVSVTVLSAFNPPSFTSTPPYEAIVGEPYFYLVGAEDPDEEDELTFRTTILPDWLQFNKNMKLLGGSPSMGDTGTVWVGLEVSDGRYSVEQLYQLRVTYRPVGLDEPRKISGGLIRNIYPVPARDRVHLSLNGNGPFEIEVLDLSGRRVLQESGNIPSEYEFYLGHLEEGVYFIRVHGPDSMESRKIVIGK
jgi:lysophospholipase L1-like esterase